MHHLLRQARPFLTLSHLSKGQETGDLGLIREEQAAVRGQRGDAAKTRAEQFFEQQGQQVQGLASRRAN
jgi:hypothetical protein